MKEKFTFSKNRTCRTGEYDANLPARNNEATTKVVACEVKHFEEPGAVISRAGICGGQSGNRLSYPDGKGKVLVVLGVHRLALSKSGVRLPLS